MSAAHLSMKFEYLESIIKGSGRAVLRPLVCHFSETSCAGHNDARLSRWWAVVDSNH